MFKENCKLAISSIKANKLRSFLTMLGIIIGIAAVIAIMTVGNTLTMAINDEMSSLGTSNIEVGVMQTDYEMEVSDAVYKETYFTVSEVNQFVNHFPNEIKAIAIDASIGSGTVGSGSKKCKVSLSGVSAGYFLANEKKLAAGSFLSAAAYEQGSSVCMVADTLVDTYFDGDTDKALGSSIEFYVNDEYLPYTIVGIYENESSSSLFSMGGASTTVFVPLKNAWLKTHDESISYFTVVTSGDVDASTLADEMTAYLTKTKELPEGFEFSCYSMQSAIDQVNQITGTVTTAISFIAAIALVVGGIGVMNIMTVSITERTKEIGTRKALGAEDSHIMMQFITEAIILCIIGGIIGMLLGISIGAIASAVMGYSAHVSIKSILIALGFSTAIGVFFGYYPAKKAADMNPIDALRYE